MKQAALSGALISSLILAEQSAVAAQGIRPGYHREVQSAVFAGGSLTIPLGERRASAPYARLQLSTMHTSRDMQSASSQRTYLTPGLQLGLSDRGSPNFYVGGQNSRELERRFGVKGDTTTWLLIGGVAAILIVAVAVGSAGGCLGPSMKRDC